MPKRFLIFVAIVQGILWIGHALLGATAVAFFSIAPGPAAAILFVLSLTFVSASLIGHRRHGPVVRLYYRFAAVWLAVGHVLLLASAAAWAALGLFRLAALGIGPVVGAAAARMAIGSAALGAAAAVAAYGLVKARLIRVARYRVRAAAVPAAWRGRKAVWISDVHLGYVNGAPYARRVVGLVHRLQPDIVFIGGDLFDGTDGNLDELFTPLRDLTAPLGVYFITGNHEEFFDREAFLAPVRAAGNVRILLNEAVEIEGLRLIGVDFRETADPRRYADVLARLTPGMSPSPAGTEFTVLLRHDPSHNEVAERAGVDVQLSGHTHGGQIWPFTKIAERVYGARNYGHSQTSRLQTITSSGVGTWGPPMRLGTQSEVVEIVFE